MVWNLPEFISTITSDHGVHRQPRLGSAGVKLASSLGKQVYTSLLHAVFIEKGSGIGNPDIALGPSMGLCPALSHYIIHQAPRIVSCIYSSDRCVSPELLKRVYNGHTGVCACAIPKASLRLHSFSIFRAATGTDVRWLVSKHLHSPEIEMLRENCQVMSDL